MVYDSFDNISQLNIMFINNSESINCKIKILQLEIIIFF